MIYMVLIIINYRNTFFLHDENKSILREWNFEGVIYFFFYFVFEDVYWMHDDNFLSWQNYIHGSSQGQFIAETYIVFFLSILTNIKEILGYWNTTFSITFFEFLKICMFLYKWCYFLQFLVMRSWLSDSSTIYSISERIIRVLELVWKCNGKSNLWWNLHSIHILYLCILFYLWHTYYFHFLRSREVIVSQLCFSGFSCRNVS